MTTTARRPVHAFVLALAPLLAAAPAQADATAAILLMNSVTAEDEARDRAARITLQAAQHAAAAAAVVAEEARTGARKPADLAPFVRGDGVTAILTRTPDPFATCPRTRGGGQVRLATRTAVWTDGQPELALGTRTGVVHADLVRVGCPGAVATVSYRFSVTLLGEPLDGPNPYGVAIADYATRSGVAPLRPAKD